MRHAIAGSQNLICFSGLEDESCAQTYDLTLGAVGATNYPETEGTFHKVCQSTNNWPIYKKENSSEILQFITDGSEYAIWYFTEKASMTSPPKVLKTVALSGECPGPESQTLWFIQVVITFSILPL